MANQPSPPDSNHSNTTLYLKTVTALSATDGISDSFRQSLLQLDNDMINRIAHAGGILRREVWPCGLARENVLQTAEQVWQALPNSIESFLVAFQAALPLLSKREIKEWVDFGWQFQKALPEVPLFCDVYFQNSPIFFSERKFGSLDLWVDEALRIADLSVYVAKKYIELTPDFVDSDSLLHLREWGGKIREILALDFDSESAALGFIETSVELLKHISYRIFQSWCTAGMQLLRKSQTTARQFYRRIPQDMSSLYQTEMRKIFDLTTLVSKELPEKRWSFINQQQRTS